LAERATSPPAGWRANARAARPCAALARPLRVVALLVLFLLAPEAAHATGAQGQIAIGKWKSMDKCAAEAQRAYPDFTAESNAQRDAKLKECLAGQNLPPRGTPPPSR
jgi:hypothetical protein